MRTIVTSQSVCVDISETTRPNFAKFCARCLWPWLVSPLATARLVLHNVLSGASCYVCNSTTVPPNRKSLRAKCNYCRAAPTTGRARSFAHIYCVNTAPIVANRSQGMWSTIVASGSERVNVSSVVGCRSHSLNDSQCVDIGGYFVHDGLSAQDRRPVCYYNTCNTNRKPYLASQHMIRC